MTPQNRRAFTLVELLVVIAIIGIIAALLFPVFVQAREKAHQTTCASNLRQIGLAAHLYLEDYDEIVFPNTTDDGMGGGAQWSQSEDAESNCDLQGGLLQPYLRNTDVLSCPSAADTHVPYQATCTVPYGLNLTYLYNPRYQGDWPHGMDNDSIPISAAQVDLPAETLLIADAADWNDGKVFRSTDIYPPSSGVPNGHARHQGWANVLWFDGHIKALRPAVPDGFSIGVINPTPPAAMLRAARLGVFLKYPYTGNGRIDDYYYQLKKYRP